MALPILASQKWAHKDDIQNGIVSCSFLSNKLLNYSLCSYHLICPNKTTVVTSE